MSNYVELVANKYNEALQDVITWSIRLSMYLSIFCMELHGIESCSDRNRQECRGEFELCLSLSELLHSLFVINLRSNEDVAGLVRGSETIMNEMDFTSLHSFLTSAIDKGTGQESVFKRF